MLKKDLVKLGLSNKEAEVYLAILELGDASVERIAQKSKVKRTTVYDVVKDLGSKGLIGTMHRNKRKYFYVDDPRKLEEQLEEKKVVLKNILPELLSMANVVGRKPKIKYFEGPEGMKNVYLDTLRYPNQEILMWGTEKVFDCFEDDFLWDYYVKKRVQSKIWMRAVAVESVETKKIQAMDNSQLRQTRLSPFADLGFEVEINLYGNKCIGIISFEEQIGLIIESEKMFKTLKSFFELHWRMLNK